MKKEDLMIGDWVNIQTIEEAESVIMKDMFEENEQAVICEY